MTSKKGEKENIQLDALTVIIKENQRPLVNLVNEPETKRSMNPLDKKNIQLGPLAINNKENQRPLFNPTNVSETKRSRNPLDGYNFKPDQLKIDINENKRQLVDSTNESETKRSSSSVGEENIQPDQLTIENKGNQRPLVNLVNESETKKISSPQGEIKTNVMEPVPFRPHVNYKPPTRNVEDNCHENDVGSAAPEVLAGIFDPPPPPHDPLPPIPPPDNGPPQFGPPDNGPPGEPEADRNRQDALLPRNNVNEASSHYARQFLRSHYHFHFGSILLIIFFLLAPITVVLVTWISKIKYFGFDGRIVFLIVSWGLSIVAYCYTIVMDYKRCGLMDPVAHMPSRLRHNQFFYVSFGKGIVWIEKPRN